jgi:GrpB-like predicted nucleotidyltransferase (UPF0157 family)
MDYKNRKYTIEDYNPDWVNEFQREKCTLSKIFGTYALSIEHIGSTAVPGLSGKPIIDVLVTVNMLSDAEQYTSAMIENGYIDKGAYVSENSRLFVKEENNIRLVNIHIFPKEHDHIAEMLKVRDYLRQHAEKVDEYNKLKIALYNKYPNDYGMYRKYKDEWMDKLVKSIV